MESTILIAGNASRLNADMAHEALSKKYRVMMTTEPGADLPPIPAGLEEGLQYVEWNRRSPISARFVVLQAQNQELDIDHAVLVYSPPNEKIMAAELSSAFIEEKLDFDCKGFVFLLKELLGYFAKRQKGSITFLLNNPGPDVLPPMESILEGAFMNLGESMFAYQGQGDLVLRGIQSRSNQNRQIAEFLIQTIQENHPKNRNKWIKYTGKSGLFFGRQ